MGDGPDAAVEPGGRVGGTGDGLLRGPRAACRWPCGGRSLELPPGLPVRLAAGLSVLSGSFRRVPPSQGRTGRQQKLPSGPLLAALGLTEFGPPRTFPASPPSCGVCGTVGGAWDFDYCCPTTDALIVRTTCAECGYGWEGPPGVGRRSRVGPRGHICAEWPDFASS
jgi:hypothetical protein